MAGHLPGTDGLPEIVADPAFLLMEERSAKDHG
jgi:hypothetical protein